MLMLEVIAVVAAAVVLVLIARWTKSRTSGRETIDEYPVGYTGQFVGLFMPHWEVGRFVWFIDGATTERLGPSGNCCELIVDGSALASAGIQVNKGSEDVPTQLISFKGEIVAIGDFGRMGNRYRVKVLGDLIRTDNA